MKLLPATTLTTLALALTQAISPCNAATISVTVTPPTASSPVWQGWGLSLAWLGNLFGDDELLADALFTLDTDVQLIPGHDDLLPGLGLNIARYNVGGTCGGQRDGLADGALYQGVSVEACTYGGETSGFDNIQDYKRIQTFWMNWGSTDPTDTDSWRWDVDLNQRTMVQNAKARNPDMIFELFSNSPPWWMTKNKYTSGGTWLAPNNLQDWNEEDFGYYLATVAWYFSDNFGVDFHSVAPFNEPQGGGSRTCWWTTPDTSQEGCCMDTLQQGRVIDHLRVKLDEVGLQDILISASDESYVDRAINTYDGLGESTKNNIDQINVHGYQGLGSDRQILHDRAAQAGKTLWLSEYGEDDLWPGTSDESNGFRMVENIYTDFIELKMTSWSYWQPLDETYGWGLIKFSNDATTSWWGEDTSFWNVHYKYYVFCQFTRHIRPGYKIIEASGSYQDNHVLVAYSDQDERLVVVATRYGSANDQITFDLSQFDTTTAGAVSSWVTDTVLSKKYKAQSPEVNSLSGNLLQTTLNPWSIQSIEVEGVKMLSGATLSPTISSTNSPTSQPTSSPSASPMGPVTCSSEISCGDEPSCCLNTHTCQDTTSQTCTGRGKNRVCAEETVSRCVENGGDSCGSTNCGINSGKDSCNADSCCRWKNKDKVCIPSGRRLLQR